MSRIEELFSKKKSGVLNIYCTAGYPKPDSTLKLLKALEANGADLVQKALSLKPDIIILNTLFSGKQEVVKTLRFEKGLENVLFLIYQ